MTLTRGCRCVLKMRWISDLSRRNSLRGNENVQSPTRKTLPLDEMPMQCSAARTINNLSMETGPLPRIKRLPDQDDDNPRTDEQTPPLNGHGSASSIERIKKIFMFFEPKGCLKERDDYSLYLFPLNNRYVSVSMKFHVQLEILHILCVCVCMCNILTII